MKLSVHDTEILRMFLRRVVPRGQQEADLLEALLKKLEARRG